MNDFYCQQVLSKKTSVNVVFETDLVLAFHHTQPFFEHHIVIIPKAHIDSLSSPKSLNPALATDFFKTINYICKKLENEQGGCRISSNVGNYQSTKHLHWYVHAGKRMRNEDGSDIET